jgi:hypothetical protein
MNHVFPRFAGKRDAILLFDVDRGVQWIIMSDRNAMRVAKRDNRYHIAYFETTKVESFNESKTCATLRNSTEFSLVSPIDSCGWGWGVREWAMVTNEMRLITIHGCYWIKYFVFFLRIDDSCNICAIQYLTREREGIIGCILVCLPIDRDKRHSLLKRTCYSWVFILLIRHIYEATSGLWTPKGKTWKKKRLNENAMFWWMEAPTMWQCRRDVHCAAEHWSDHRSDRQERMYLATNWFHGWSWSTELLFTSSIKIGAVLRAAAISGTSRVRQIFFSGSFLFHVLLDYRER